MEAHSQTQEKAEKTEQEQDATADIKAIVVVFGAAVLLAVHWISGFSFDI